MGLADRPPARGAGAAPGAERRGSLAGVKVAEFAQVIAGPLAGTLMADLGADVVHVESPGRGDVARTMGPAKEDTHLWWKVLNRNKRSVTLDLHRGEARALVERLVRWADVVIVTFRADTLERFGLDWPSVSAVDPSTILLQISGYGATSSKRNEPGLGKVGEARSGVVHLTGFEDDPPVHTGFSHGDATTGLMGAFAVAAALVRRDAEPERRGEWIDLALYETLFRLIDWQVIVHDQTGAVPHRAGNGLAVAPAAIVNAYRTADGSWITVTSATQRSVLNIVRLLGFDLDRFATVAMQQEGGAELDEALARWMAQQPSDQALAKLGEAGVVASKIFDVEDIFADETYRERENIVSVPDEDLGTVRMQAPVPRFHAHPGSVWRTGPRLGADNELVYCDWLGVEAERLRDLAAEGVV